MPRFGAHLSIQGGVHKAVERARTIQKKGKKVPGTFFSFCVFSTSKGVQEKVPGTFFRFAADGRGNGRCF